MPLDTDKLKALAERLRDTSAPILEVIRERANDKQLAADALDALLAENQRLRGALKLHGRHLNGCFLYKYMNDGICSCGLSKALSGEAHDD